MSNTCSLNAQPLPEVLAFKLTKWDNRQNDPTTFQQLSCASVHKLGNFVAGEKVGHFVEWDNLSPEKCQLTNGFLLYMLIAAIRAKNCPRYIQDMPQIRASFAQGMGIQIENVGQNVAREGASVGTLCRQGGAKCNGTFCRWDILSPNQISKKNSI